MTTKGTAPPPFKGRRRGCQFAGGSWLYSPGGIVPQNDERPRATRAARAFAGSQLLRGACHNPHSAEAERIVLARSWVGFDSGVTMWGVHVTCHLQSTHTQRKELRRATSSDEEHNAALSAAGHTHVERGGITVRMALPWLVDTTWFGGIARYQLGVNRSLTWSAMTPERAWQSVRGRSRTRFRIQMQPLVSASRVRCLLHWIGGRRGVVLVKQHHMIEMIRYLDREEIRQVACPRCEAQPGSPCRNPDGSIRQANHANRVDAAAEQLAVTLPHIARKVAP